MTIALPAPFRLVPYAPEHQSATIELIRSVYAEYHQVLELDTLDDDLPVIPARYPAPDHAFRVLLDGDRLVGTVAVKQTGEAEAELKRLFLDPTLRGRGLGRALVDWATAFAAGRGARVLHIWSDVTFLRSHKMYRALGAEDTGRTRRLGGRNDVVERYFCKRLEPPPAEPAGVC